MSKSEKEADYSMRYAIMWLVIIILIGILVLIINECAIAFSNVIMLSAWDVHGIFLLMNVLGIYFTFLIFMLIIRALVPPTKEERGYYKKCKEIEKKYKSYEIQKLKKREAKHEWKLKKVRDELKEAGK